MKKTVCLIFCCLMTGGLLHAQSFNWVKQIAGSGASADIICMEFDGSGNILLAGNFSGSVDFDPGPGNTSFTAMASTDIFYGKYQPDGTLIWVKKIGGSSADRVRAVAQDTDGNILMTGGFKASVDFDPGPGNQTHSSTVNGPSITEDIFIAKYTTTGDFVWAHDIGDTGQESGASISADTSGNVFVTGAFSGSFDFNPGGNTNNLTSYGSTDIFVLKLNSAGDYVHAIRIGESQPDSPNQIYVTPNGDVYLAGYFYGTVDFDPTGATYNLVGDPNSYDGFLARYQNDLTIVWPIKFTGTGECSVSNFRRSADGDIYLTGNFTGETDFDPSGGTATEIADGATHDAFIVKVDGNGAYQWSEAFGGTGEDWARAMALDSEENVFLTGDFTLTCDFDQSAGVSSKTSNGESDIFLHKSDSSGNFVWAKTIGSASFDYGRSVLATGAGEIYAVGTFMGNADFNPDAGVYNVTLVGSGDGYLLKLGNCTSTSETISPTACNSIVINGQTYSAGGTYTQTLTNAAGCDSVLTINLTVNTVDVSVTANATNLTANQSGATYQWVDCDNAFSPVAGATSQTFTPSVSGNYAVIVTTASCTDTSACNSFSTSVDHPLNSSFTALYPNPADNQLTIRVAGEFTLSMISIEGKVMTTATIRGEETFDVSGLPAGLYLVRIENSKGETGSTRFIKK